MAVGAIGSVTSTLYNPYVYNTNSLSKASLNKINAIPDDVTKAKTEVEPYSNDLNVNPLSVGETKNFADVLMSQMSRSSYKQAQVLATNPFEM